MSNALSPFQRCLRTPTLGVGLGVDVYDTRPNVKKLLKRRDGFDFLELYTRGDAKFSDGPLSSLPADVPRTYHHEGLDPVGPGLPPDERIEGCAKNLRLCGAPWCVEELAVRHINGRYTDFFFPAILTKPSLRATVGNLRALQARLPAPLLPEIAPYEFVVGRMHVLDFLREVAHGADCGVVLDLGHLYSYQLCVGRPPLDGIERMDLARVIEVHLAGARIEHTPGGGIYRDLHGAGPIPRASLEMLAQLAPRLPNLRAVTVEVEDAPEPRAFEQVAQVREVLAKTRPDFVAAPNRGRLRDEAVAKPGQLGGNGFVHTTSPSASAGRTELERSWDALYRLFYKRGARARFMRGQAPPGLSAAERAQLAAVDPARLEAVVALHAPDIAGWYRGRVPATWLALRAALVIDERELVARLADSDAFELRVNDDEGCQALAGFIGQARLSEAPWLADLLRYELLIAGQWPDERSPRVERFAFDVEGIRHALLEQSLCPTGEKRAEHAVLFHRGESEVNEAPLTSPQAVWLEASLGKMKAPARVLRKIPAGKAAALGKRCLELLRAVGACLLLVLALAGCDQSLPRGPFADAVGNPDPKLPAIKLAPAFPKLKFSRPVWLVHAGDGTERLFVIEQYGKIFVFENKPDVASAKVFLDLSDKIVTDSNEEGVLCLAFHPRFKDNGYCYVNYNAYNPHRSVIARFSIAKTDRDKADLASEKVILEISQQYFNHKGCTLLFGKDGYLYASFGDGGSQQDPHGNGQNLGTLLGSVLRIDVDKEEGGKAYAVPKDNPFVGREGARPEIWAYGLRNTWRMSFDPETGGLWGGDAGQNRWEEINLLTRGGNYGWNAREGFHEFQAGGKAADPFIDPVVEYSNSLGRAIIGGYVYRGEKFAALQGVYFYADYSSGRVWGLRYKDGKAADNGEVLRTLRPGISSFGVDAKNELYAVAFGWRRTEEGEILRVEPE